MPPVVLTFSPAAEHVRTARLVVVAVARRAGVGEARLEDVRLAVGEICARAVSRCASSSQATSPVAVVPVTTALGVAGSAMSPAGSSGPLAPPETVAAAHGSTPWRIRVEIQDAGPLVRVMVTDPAGAVELPDDPVTMAVAEALADTLSITRAQSDGCETVELGWQLA